MSIPSPAEPPRRVEWVWAVIVAAAVAVAGVLLGLAWYLVAPKLPLRKVDGGLINTQPYPEEQIAADGWFSILGLIFGVLAAVLVWFLLRRFRGPVQMVGLMLGAVVAGWMAWQVGKGIDQSTYREEAEQAAIGAIVEKPIDLSANGLRLCLPGSEKCTDGRAGDLLVPAFGSVVAYALLAGWSRWPNLRREEDEEDDFNSATEWDQAGQEWPARPESP